MTVNGRKDDTSQERDRLAVAAIYRRTADETTPHELNRAVLQHATRQTRGVASRTLTWLRPAALAATLALSVALVLQVGNLDSTGTSPGELPGPVASGENDDVFDAAAEASMEQIRAAESAAKLSPGPSESLTAPRNQVGPGPTSNEVVRDNQDCSADQRSSTVTWWRCIQALEKRGMSEAARRELEALFEAYPAFRSPE